MAGDREALVDLCDVETSNMQVTKAKLQWCSGYKRLAVFG